MGLMVEFNKSTTQAVVCDEGLEGEGSTFVFCFKLE